MIVRYDGRDVTGDRLKNERGIMQRKKNRDVRAFLKSKRVFLWEAAERLGVHETTLVRWMRTELPDEKKKEIMEAAAAVAADR